MRCPLCFEKGFSVPFEVWVANYSLRVALGPLFGPSNRKALENWKGWADEDRPILALWYGLSSVVRARLVSALT